MLFNGVEVLLKTFTIKPSLNASMFKGSNGRTKHRVRTNNSVNWEANATFDFQDLDKALDFSDSLKPLQSYELQIGAGDVDFLAPEMQKTGGITKVFLKSEPRLSTRGYKNTNVSLSVVLDKTSATAPSGYDASIFWAIPYKWSFTNGVLRKSEFHETYSGDQSITGNLVTGRSAKFSYYLTYEEYVEVLKTILWGVRYSDFVWAGEISIFAKGSLVRITNFSFKYTGKRMYNVDLVIESF